jgi:hypothetical protein
MQASDPTDPTERPRRPAERPRRFSPPRPRKPQRHRDPDQPNTPRRFYLAHNQRLIEQMRPLDAVEQLDLRNVVVFTDAETKSIILSLIGHRGSLNIPLSRKAAACVAYRLTQQLI